MPSTVTNTAQATRLYLQSDWSDFNNQDGVRPGSVDVSNSITYRVSNNEIVPKTSVVTKLRPVSSDSDMSTLAEGQETTHWPAYGMLVPASQLNGDAAAYSAVQDTPAKYDTTGPSVTDSYTPTGLPAGKLYAFSNVHTPQKVKLEITKKWTVYEYNYYIPNSISLKLEWDKGSGWDTPDSPNNAPVVLTKPDTGAWPTAKWGEDGSLPARYSSGYTNVASVGTSDVVQYRVSEVLPVPKGFKTPPNSVTAAFTTSLSSITNTGVAIALTGTPSSNTITNTLDTVSYEVKKAWVDSNNLYKSRPAEADGSTKVRIALYRKIEGGSYERAKGTDGITDLPVETLTTTASGIPVASKTWSNLPKYDTEGNQYTYFARELSIGGADGTTHGVEGFDPDTLLGGEAYNYVVSYSAAGVSPQTVTNTVKAIDETTQITLTKFWSDNGPQDDLNGGQDGKRPAQINVMLFRDGVDTETVTLNRAGGWSHTFTNLPKYQNGSSTDLSAYTFKEGAAYDSETGTWKANPPAWYTLTESEFTNPENTAWRITNTHEPLTMRITATKTWNDSNNVVDVRPEKIDMTLEDSTDGSTWNKVTADQSGASITTKTLQSPGNDTGPWPSAEWENLPQYRGGKKLKYRVVETAVGGYSAVGSYTAVGGYTTTYAPSEPVTGSDGQDDAVIVAVTNTIKLTSFRVEKQWQEPNGTALLSDVTLPADDKGVTVALYRRLQGQDMSEAKVCDQANIEDEEKTLTATGGWAYTWSGLLAEDPETGTAYVYDARETFINGLPLSEGTAAGFTLHTEDNSIPGKTTITNRVNRGNIPVTKIWGDADGFNLGVDYVTVQLQRKDKGTGDWANVPGKTLNIPYDNAAAHKFIGIQLQDLAGAPYEYRAVEISLTLNDDAGTVVPVIPDAVDGPLKGRVGSYSYTTAVNSATNATTITNTLETVSLTVQKVWVDNDNQDGKRPGTLTVKLIRDGVDTGKTVTLEPDDDADDANVWTYTLTNLPKYKNDGTGESVYTFDEGDIALYSLNAGSSGLSGDGETYTLTNTYAPKTMTVEAIKTWDDGSDVARVRPASVELTLQARLTGDPDDAYETVEQDQDGDGIDGVVTIGAADSWKATWPNLPQYREGTKLEYRVVETRVGGYATDYAPASVTGSGIMGDEKGIVVTNTIIPTSFTVEKLWLDPGEALPDNITVALYRTADGKEELVEARTLRAANTDGLNRWVYKWTGLLAESPDGTTYVYHAEETEINGTALNTANNNSAAGYTRGSQTTEGNITTVTNSVNRGSIGVRKSWADYDYDMDVGYVTVQLQRKNVGVWTDVPGKTLDIPYNTAAAQYFTGIQLQDLAGNAYEYRVMEKSLTLTDGTTTVDAVPDAEDPLIGTIGAYRYTTSVTGNSTAITNTLALVSFPVAKTWNDSNNQDGIRPNALNVSLWRDGGATAFATATLTGSDWSHTFVDLPKHQDGSGQNESVYTVTEAGVAGYTPGAHGLAGGIYMLVNGYTPKVMSVEATKIWVDGNDAAGLRPASVELMLQDRMRGGSWQAVAVDQDGSPLTSITLGPDGSGNWTNVAKWEKLPQRKNGQPIEYRVVETPVANYTASYSDAFVQGSGVMSETQTMAVTNTYIPRLKVDNVTVNPANPAKTDVGGKVAIAGATPPAAAPNAPDAVEYQDNALAVAWCADPYYKLSDDFTVWYRRSDSDASVSITVSDYLDAQGKPKPISDPAYAALKAVYPDAHIELLPNGTVYLRLGNTPIGLPAYTAVDVLFEPTLAVENTAVGNRGGTVQVENGAENNQSDGVPAQDGHNRYTEIRVIGKAVSGYCVDVKNLTIGLPTTSNGDVGQGNLNAVKIQFDQDGRFTAKIPTELNGVKTTLSVSGTVKLTGSPDRYTEVEITLDTLGIPLDIGIPFGYPSSDSGGDSDDPIKPDAPEKPKDDVPESVFWDNVGELITTAKPGDVIKVNTGLFENLPPSIYGLLQTYPGITLELTDNNGRIRVLSAGSTNPNPGTGGIWEISAPGSIPAITSGSLSTPSQETALAAEPVAEPVLAVVDERLKAPSRTAGFGAWFAAILLFGSGIGYLTKRARKKKTM